MIAARRGMVYPAIAYSWNFLAYWERTTVENSIIRQSLVRGTG